MDEITINIYPNPAERNLKLDISRAKSDKLKFQIFDVSGNKISEFETIENDYNIDVSNYPSGYYIVKCISEKGNTTFRNFVKN